MRGQTWTKASFYGIIYWMKKETQKIYDIAIIGGGAAGMMTAITSAQNSSDVVLIEKNTELGRKILATGNGRCNLTNRFIDVNRYHGGNPEFIGSILKQFDQFKTMQFFEDLGLILKEENLGRIFPRSDQAKSIVDALTHKLEEKKVDIKLNDQVRKINKIGEAFEITLASGNMIKSYKLILTAGGCATEHLGTSGDAYFWLKQMGHSVTDLFPALTPLEISQDWVKEVQGLKVEANVSSIIDNKKIYEKFGDLLFTHFGVSGPAAMAQAGAIGPYLNKADVKISIDLFPEIEAKDLDLKIIKIIEASGAKQIKNVLAGLIPANLAPILLKNLSINPDKKAAEISKIDRANICKTLINIELTVSGVRPFKEAQVTHGGVNLDEIDFRTLQSKIVPGLYFAGEILDVDGDSGGFNLQWAWSSGYLVGLSCSK